jgi:hypothetical protein
MEDLFSDQNSNPASGDIEWGTIANAIVSDPNLPFSDWKENVIELAKDLAGEYLGPDLVNDPMQWAQDNPLAAAGIGAAAIAGGAAYYDSVGSLEGSFGFEVGDWQFDIDLGLSQDEVDGSDDFHFQLNVTYPF